MRKLKYSNAITADIFLITKSQMTEKMTLLISYIKEPIQHNLLYYMNFLLTFCSRIILKISMVKVDRQTFHFRKL